MRYHKKSASWGRSPGRRKRKRPSSSYHFHSGGLKEQSCSSSTTSSPVQPSPRISCRGQLQSTPGRALLPTRTLGEVRKSCKTPVPPVPGISSSQGHAAYPGGQKRRRHQNSRRHRPANMGHKSSSKHREKNEVLQKPVEEMFQQALEKVSLSGNRPVKRPRKARLEKLYEKEQLLGRGGYGSVFAGTRRADGALVAIKYVSKAKAEENLVIPGQGVLPLEVALMTIANAAPQCANILQMLDWYDQPTRYIMVLERPEPCQDLKAFCQDQGGSLSESLARKVMVQLLKALHHCKRCRILHRDVKPENLLIQTDTHNVKLFDFGCGDLWKDSAYKDFAGTLEYSPPEWFLQRQFLADPATVWSVGVTLFSLVCGFLPFNTIRETIKGRLCFTKGLSSECRQLLHWCLSTKASDRPSLEEIEHHTWLNIKDEEKQPGVSSCCGNRKI